ncbi:pilus assembly PilX family protein [Pseudomonas caspiana]
MSTHRRSLPSSQKGMVLVVSLIFLLLLTLLGVSAMQNATMQEKMAGSVMVRNQSFQFAEAALRLGESAIQKTDFVLAKCTPVANCAPPSDSTGFPAAGAGASGVTWVQAGTNAVYALQNIGTTTTPISRPPTCSANATVTLYRVTASAKQGTSVTVLESIYANC